MSIIYRHPLGWYVEKLNRGEPFTSALYGDGELLVASRARTGSVMANGERVTPAMEEEMRAALLDDSPDVLRGTDPFLINYETYQGGDRVSIHAMGRQFRAMIAALSPDKELEWVDGVVWDEAVREGNLGPFLKALHAHRVVLVGNHKHGDISFIHKRVFVEVPGNNAYGDIDRIEKELNSKNAADPSYARESSVYLICAGLTAAPLIRRLRRTEKDARGGVRDTYIDLGSVLDVFVGLGAGRGWRAELYAYPPRLKEVINKNLEGVCDPNCPNYQPTP